MVVNRENAGVAAEILGVNLEGLTTTMLGKAYRSKSKYYHPDTAVKFDAEKWERICWAKRILLQWLDKHVASTKPENACRACDGSGRIRVVRSKGFGAKITTMMCAMCHGAGTLPEEKARAFQGD